MTAGASQTKSKGSEAVHLDPCLIGACYNAVFKIIKK